MRFYLDIPDTCLHGYASVWTGESSVTDVAVYDGEKIAAHLMTEGLSREEAEEHISFNMVGAYIGPDQPIIMWPAPPEVVQDIADTLAQM